MNDINVKELNKAELRKIVRQATRQMRRIEKEASRKTVKSSDENVVRIANDIRQVADEMKVKRTDVLNAIAANMRVKLSGTTGRRAGSSKSGAGKTVRFRDPKDPSKTWAGTGRPPNWLKEALDKGKTLDDFRV